MSQPFGDPIARTRDNVISGQSGQDNREVPYRVIRYCNYCGTIDLDPPYFTVHDTDVVPHPLFGKHLSSTEHLTTFHEEGTLRMTFYFHVENYSENGNLRRVWCEPLDVAR